MACEKEPKDVCALVTAVIEGLDSERDLKRKLGNGPSIPCGLTDVDAFLRGFWPGDLIALVSGPAVGRSAFAFQIAFNAAMSGTQVSLFSLESDAETVVLRMLSSDARVSASKIQGGYVTESEHAALSDASSRFPKSLLIYDESLALDTLGAIARSNAANADKHLIIVDGPELLEGGDGKADLGEAAVQLRRLAREVNAPVFMTVGVPSKDARSVRRKKCWPGKIMDLVPDVSAIADVVALLDRSLDELEADSMYGAPKLNTATLLVAKNRRGWQRSITLSFIMEYTRFLDYVDDRYL